MPSLPARFGSFRIRPAVERLDDRITPVVSFAPQQAFAVGANPQGIAVGDFNGDGRPDVAVVNADADTVSVLLNTSVDGAAVSFAPQATFAVGDRPVAVAVGDVTGDGRADIVVANATAGTVSVLTNVTPSGATVPTFAAQATFAVDTNPVSVAVADFDGDGRADIATASNPNLITATVSILRNVEAGSGVPAFAVNQQVFSTVNAFGPVAAAPLVVADFDGDGRADLTANESVYQGHFISTTVHMALLNTTPAGGAFSFTRRGADITTGELAVGDFNADGRLSGFPLNSGSTAGDFDGDGRTDVAILFGTSVDVRPNTTPTFTPTPSFGASQLFAVGENPKHLATADFDGDGRLDLVSTNTGGFSDTHGTVSVLRNTSTGGTVTGPSLVGQFGTAGVWRYNRATGGWDQLTLANADALAAAPNGSVVASFGDSGVWYFNPAHGWYQINGNRATAVAIDGLGNPAASFLGFGTALYRQADGWSAPLTTVVADKLAMNAAGKLAAAFPGYGLYTYTPAAGWTTLLNGQTAAALAVAANGDVAASFAGYGTYLHAPTTSWELLNGSVATALAAGGDGAVVASFGSYGVAKYIPHANGWQVLHAGTPAASVAMDLYGNVFVTLGTFGLYEFSPTFGWRLRTTSAANLLGLG